MALNTYDGVQNAKDYFYKEIYQNAIHKYAYIYANQDATGDYLHHSKNTKYCFDSYDLENVKYGNRVLKVKDSYDMSGVAWSELIYESMSATANSSRCFFCYMTIGSSECEYSLSLRNCSNCFMCVGLTNAKYCILNKQYEKDEYFKKVEEIKQNMKDSPFIDTKGQVYSYGEYFPFSMCLFGYNETNANDTFPLSKDKLLEYGYPFYDRPSRDYSITLQSSDLPNSILDVNDDILKQTIGCPNEGKAEYQCTTAYRITPEELSFYRQKKLPLPRYCPNCRHYQRLQYRNPMHLYTRQCYNNCGTTFQTTYSPEQKYKIFCEKCYQREVL